MATIYSGIKSVDAEIIIDFFKETVIIDYGRNSEQGMGNSNSGICYSSTWDKAPGLLRLKQAVLTTTLLISERLWLPFVLLPITILQGRGFLLGKKQQLLIQQFRKWFYVNLRGVVERITPIASEIVTVHIPNNLWVQYELSVVAQDKVASIKLLRHFDTFYRYGKWYEVRQNGWDMIFEFTSVPAESYVSVKYVA